MSQAKKKGLLGKPEFKARADKIITNIINEIDDLPINPETGKIYRGSAKVIIDECLEMHHWLSRDMIVSRRRRIQQAKELSEAAAELKPKNSQKVPLYDLKPVPEAGRKKGTTNLAIREGKRKFNDMKNDIVRT